MIQNYTVLDLETTGLNPKKNRIIEVGAVRVRGGRIVEEFQAKINPGRTLEPYIVELTGIRDEDLRMAPEVGEVIPALLEFMEDDILVGHSILFDYSFVKREAVNLNLSFEKQAIDTLKLARKFLPDLDSKRLPFLCKYFDIPHNAHRALADAVATAALFEKMKELFENENDFIPSPLVYQTKKETPITKPQKERLYKLMEKHTIIIGYDLEKLTKNEASRITDKILATYGQ